jgi:hypothetical protein
VYLPIKLFGAPQCVWCFCTVLVLKQNVTAGMHGLLAKIEGCCWWFTAQTLCVSWQVLPCSVPMAGWLNGVLPCLLQIKQHMPMEVLLT